MKIHWLGACALLLAACGGNTEPVAVETAQEADILIQDRFRLFESAADHDTTLTQLLQSLDRRDLNVFALIDHQAGAENADLQMPPSTLVIFGNPKAGTPLMVAEPLLGAELPLRALVYETEGKVMLAVTGTDFLEREYGLERQSETLDRIASTLETIATEATAP